MSSSFKNQNVSNAQAQPTKNQIIETAMIKHKRLKRERDTVNKMIALYCKSNHSPHSVQLCQDCQDLETYAHQRIKRCPYGTEKPTCAKCPVHCYKSDRRETIRQVMRFSGPRVLFHHPILAILHLLDGCRKPPSR